MTLEQLEYLFISHGYHKIPSNLPEFTFYYHKENQGVNVIHVIHYRSGLYISEDQYSHLKEKIREFFVDRGEQEIHIMSFILSEDLIKAKQLCVTDNFCWIIDTAMDRLIIYENQVSDFYGWKQILENYLEQKPYLREEKSEVLHSTDKQKPQWKELPWVTIGLVTINILIFMICTFTGDLLYNKGALSVMNIVEEHSCYRMLTSMFLHADIQHLFSNMIVLYFLGEIVEKRLGHIPYTILYFLSGIAGDVFSMGYELLTQHYISSVGASGAIFGVEGALLLLIILNHGKIESMTAGRVAFAIAFSLYCGLTGSQVNNAAHVGGVLMGFAASAVIVCLSSRAGRRKD